MGETSCKNYSIRAKASFVLPEQPFTQFFRAFLTLCYIVSSALANYKVHAFNKIFIFVAMFFAYIWTFRYLNIFTPGCTRKRTLKTSVLSLTV